MRSSDYSRLHSLADKPQARALRKPDHLNEGKTMCKQVLTTLAVLVLIAATGCQQTPVAESNQAFAGNNETGFVTYMAQTGEKVDSDMGDERAIRLHENVIAPLRDMEKGYAAGSMTSEEFDEGARDILEVVAEDTGIVSTAEQFVAHRMLYLLLKDQSASQETIAYYTDLLVQEKSPHADIIHEALGVLEGHWTEEQVKAATNKAIANAEAWLGETDERMHISEDKRGAIGTAVKDMSQLAE